MPTQALEHLSEQRLEDYRQRLLSSEEKSEVHDHIADCEDCRLLLKRRLYGTEKERAEAGGRLINILTTVREEGLRPEPRAVATPGTTSRPPVYQRISALLTPLRLSYALPLAATILVAVIAGVLLLGKRESRDNELSSQPSRETKTATENIDISSKSVNPTAPVPPPAPTVEASEDEGKKIVAGQKQAGQKQDGLAQQASRTSNPNPQPRLHNKLNDGGSVIGLDDTGRLIGLESAPPSFREAARAAIGGELDVPQVITALGSQIPEATRSGDPTVAEKNRVVLLEPVNKVIRTNRPTFKWKPVAGSKYYDVTVVTDAYDPVDRADRLTLTQWTASEPLGADVKYYRWQVSAYPEGAGAPVRSVSSWVKVLDQDKDRELKDAEAEYAGSHLLLGSLYTRAGLLDEAEREFQLLLRSNPKSPVARRLLKDVQEKKKSTTP